jgi:hypothetical protein
VTKALLALWLALTPPPSHEDGEPLDVPQLTVPPPGVHLPAHKPPPVDELDTPRFRIFYTARAKASAEQLAKEIEPLRDSVQRVLGRDWDGVTEIRLGYDRAEMEALALPGGMPPSWATALAYPDENVMLVEAHSLVAADGRTTLRHELVHVALGRLGQGWPRWFQEGLAQALTGERTYSLTQYATLARAVSQGRVYRLDDLTHGFPEMPSNVEIAYAESAAFVSYLRDTHGEAQFAQLVDFVHQGLPFETSFAKAFHTSLALDEKAFDAELPGRYPLWPIVTGGSTLWVLAAAMVVYGWIRRRRQVLLLRAQQALIEEQEDAARAALAEEIARELLARSAEEPPSTPPTESPPTLH